MARKVFVSFLGTSNYLPTRYELGGKKSPVVRFVQQALIEMLCADWTADDRVLIFYTEESRRRNWLDNGHDRITDESERIGLQSVLKGMGLPMAIEHYEIEEGFSESEIWSIFDCVYERLQPGDRIYFDVTHAFRSIPLFSTVLFNFARLMKDAEVVSIHYGAFEKLGPAYRVRERYPNPEDRCAPIVDLTGVVELQNTNIAVNNFLEFGKVGAITDLLELEAGDSGKSVDAIKVLKAEFEKLDNYIATCRMKDIQEGKYMKNIMSRFKAARYSSYLNRSEKLLLDKILENLREFKPEKSQDNIKAAINWALKYEMIQQAYTLGQEFIVTRAVECVRAMYRDSDDYNLVELFYDNKELRLFVSAVIGMDPDAEYRFSGRRKEKADEVKALAAELVRSELVEGMRPSYDCIRENRNSLNHAKQSSKSNRMLIEEFREAFVRSLQVIDQCLEALQ